jgi:predicted Rossmann fold flavoprotein
LEIDPKKKLHSITQAERKKLLHLLKNLNVNVAGLLDFDQAIVTNGGIATREIDSKTMQSKIIPNLFFAGEILDLDGPTGGYNLQICWSTGYAAGTYAGKK